MSRPIGASVLLATALLSGCASTSDLPEPASATAAVDDFWRAIETRDIDLLAELVDRNEDLVALGTDAAERWLGSASFLAAEEQMMQAFDVARLTRRADTLQVHASGDVAWFSTVFDIEITVEGEGARLEGLRTTGVLARRDGRWVLVQIHTSIPVNGQ